MTGLVLFLQVGYLLAGKRRCPGGHARLKGAESEQSRGKGRWRKQKRMTWHVETWETGWGEDLELLHTKRRTHKAIRPDPGRGLERRAEVSCQRREWKKMKLLFPAPSGTAFMTDHPKPLLLV